MKQGDVDTTVDMLNAEIQRLHKYMRGVDGPQKMKVREQIMRLTLTRIRLIKHFGKVD